MKKNQWFAVGVMVAWLTCSLAHGQQSTAKSIYPPPPTIPINGDVSPPPAPYEPPLAGLSDFILYKRANCCEGQPGSAAPLFTEIYVRSGRAIPVGGQTLSRELDQGWSIAGGARVLFFDPGLTNAWTVDLHIMNVANGSSGLGTRFPLTVTNIPNAAGKFIPIQFGANGVPGVQVQEELTIARWWAPAWDANGTLWQLPPMIVPVAIGVSAYDRCGADDGELRILVLH